jgi:hypothetical protein
MVAVFTHRVAESALRRLVRRAVEQQKSDPSAEVFSRVWSSLLANPLYRWSMRTYVSDKEHFCLNTETLKFLAQSYPELFPFVRISASPDFVRELQRDAPFVAVQIHDGSPNLSRFLSDHKRRFSRIVRRPSRHMASLEAMQLDTARINLIKRDVTCFSRLRSAFQEGQIICSTIDYKDKDGRWAYLNPAIFGFAKRFKLPVIFIRNDVERDGRVHIFASPPHSVVEPTLSAMAFQDFYNSMPGKKINFAVKRYYEK